MNMVHGFNHGTALALTYRQPVCRTIWNDVWSDKMRGNYVTSYRTTSFGPIRKLNCLSVASFCRSIERHFTGSGVTSILTERLPLVEGFNCREKILLYWHSLPAEGFFKRVKDFKCKTLSLWFPEDYKDRLQTNIRIILRLWLNPKWESLTLRCVTFRLLLLPNVVSDGRTNGLSMSQFIINNNAHYSRWACLIGTMTVCSL